MRILAAAFLSVAACTASVPAGEGDTETATGTGTGAPLPPAPAFLQPADGVLALDTNRHADVFLSIRDVLLGRTQLEIDGVSRGTLLGGSIIGHLEAEMLTLFVHGGMVPGLHTMALWTPAEEPLRSRTIDIRLRAPEAPPAWAVAPSTIADVSAQEVRTYGHGSGTLLAYRTFDEKTHLWQPLAPESPQADDAPLPPEIPSPQDLGRIAVVVGPSPERRTVFTIEGPAGPSRRLVARCLTWQDSAWTVTDTFDVLTADAGTSGIEWAELVEVTATGESVVVERIASVDVEHPVPGDHTLLWVFDPCTSEGGWEALPVAPGIDATGVTPVLDLAALRFDAPPSVFATETDVPVIFELDASTHAVRVRHRGTGAARGGALGVAAALGTFGGVTLASAEATGIVLETALEGAGSAEFVDADPVAAAPQGPPRFFVLDGWIAAAVPLGTAVPLRLLASSGAGWVTPEIQDPLPACRDVVVPWTYDGNLGGSAYIGCLDDDALRWFEVSAASE